MMTANDLMPILQHHWGYDSYLPLQQAAIDASLSHRDALVVLPTGGGKSLCFQLPAISRDGLTIVVSPLISLMKDQVDSLRSIGVEAAALNSSLSADEQQAILRSTRDGRLKLLYLSPERLVAPSTLAFLTQESPVSIAIDEAHCISSWGHDFRPEYRQLRALRPTFPGVAIQAYTATATPQVRQDIVEQLQMSDPMILVGDFFRPNLVYHVRRRQSGWNQVCDVIERHRDAAGIIYAISRSRVEQISESLNQLGYRTLPYHAGLSDAHRMAHQEALVNDEIQAIVATVAFGMGIDKSNVRYVVHAELPKSIECYQQESGRAGRDGLEADCWLLWTAADAQLWEKIIGNAPEVSQNQSRESLRQMLEFCTRTCCRHAMLVEHFGQTFQGDCQSCDICLGKLGAASQPLELAQKIVSCVARCRENFGADHITKVLTGSKEKQILKFGHEQLSTWGLLAEEPRTQIRDWIDQLIDQGYLQRVGEFSTLSITDSGKALLRGVGEPDLLRSPQPGTVVTPTRILDSWEEVDRGLFDVLRMWRQRLARERAVPAFTIFSDVTLRDLARRRPASERLLTQVHGIGQKKAQDFGEQVIQLIGEYCQQHKLSTDVPVPKLIRPASMQSPQQSNAHARESYALFDAGQSLEQIAESMQRAPSTVVSYLLEYIRDRKIDDASRWVDPVHIRPVEIAASYNDTNRLKPIFEALHGRVPYDSIRIILACRDNRAFSANPSRPE
jgi:ATP-dependent DNA helicase RecQ